MAVIASSRVFPNKAMIASSRAFPNMAMNSSSRAFPKISIIASAEQGVDFLIPQEECLTKQGIYYVGSLQM